MALDPRCIASQVIGEQRIRRAPAIPDGPLSRSLQIPRFYQMAADWMMKLDDSVAIIGGTSRGFYQRSVDAPPVNMMVTSHSLEGYFPGAAIHYQFTVGLHAWAAIRQREVVVE